MVESRTPLELIHSARRQPLETSAGTMALTLPGSPHLQAFVDTAAANGLAAPHAVGLALERALLLADSQAFGIDIETVRRMLGAAAAAARAGRPLTDSQARYVRSLVAARPVASENVASGLTVTIPERVYTRAHGAVRTAMLHASAVSEMVAWEIAAALQGRTMGEWGLRSLALRRSAA
jgi:hypothetical protein